MSEPIRVTRLITWLPVGGIERRLVSVLPRLRDRGFDVRLVCIREYGVLADELRESGVPVDLVELKSRLHPLGIRSLAAYLRQHRTQLVHAHMYRAAVPGTIAARLARVPVIYSQIHNVDSWDNGRQVLMDRFLARARTGVICVSKAVRDDVCATLGLPREKTPILYNGSDTETFQPDEDLRRRGREELGLDDNSLAVLVPARLHSQKNPLGTLEAFAAAREKADTPVVLLFAGKGPMEEEIRARIREHGLQDSVRLLGTRDDMPALYNACDLMLLSSFKEGFSNAVVEALACGKPVVASDVGGNAEAISSRDFGWIHPPGDGDALTAQLAEAFSNPEALRSMASACRARGEVFSLDRLVEKTEKLYRDAIARLPS